MVSFEKFMDKKVVVEISARTIVFIVLFLLLLKFLWLIKDILFSLFIAFILRSALLPVVLKLKKIGIPHALAAVLIFLFTIGAFVGFFFVLLPPLFVEISSLIRNTPYYLDLIMPQLEGFVDINSLGNYIPSFTGLVFGLLGGLFSNAFFVFVTLFFTLYFLIEENFVRDLLVNFVSEEKIVWVFELMKKVEGRMAAWLWGELVLMFIIGLLTYIGLSLLNVKYALSLAFIAGLLEIIPNIGPVISTIPAFFVAISSSLVLGLSVIALYFIIQQFENTVIVPLVMRKAVGLNPIITLLALLIGGRIGGVVGVLLAIPFTLFVETLLIEMVKNR